MCQADVRTHVWKMFLEHQHGNSGEIKDDKQTTIIEECGLCLPCFTTWSTRFTRDQRSSKLTAVIDECGLCLHCVTTSQLESMHIAKRRGPSLGIVSALEPSAPRLQCIFGHQASHTTIFARGFRVQIVLFGDFSNLPIHPLTHSS